jgi:hypothetical protein
MEQSTVTDSENMKPSVDETPDQPVSSSQRILSQEEQVSRFDRWVEFFSAVVLALATVATAWCAYQSTLWGGDELKFRSAANSATIKASQASNAALQQASLHANLFVQWATAYSEQNDLLTDFLYQRFPPALKTATDAWIATQPLRNPEAPASPFAMPEYQLAEQQEAARWEEEASIQWAQAEDADQISDRYVLLTVIFASVLFFAGIAGKFQSRLIDLAMLALGLFVLLVGLMIALTFPIQLG